MLAKIVYYIFLPALMLTNVVATLSAGGASELFWLPLAALCQIAIGGIAGMLGARLLRLNPTESRVYLVCCAWGNSAALPLLFASALFADSAVRLAGMVSGISFFLLGWSGVFWGLGFHLLATLPEGNPGGAVAEKRETESFDQRMRMVLKRVFSPPLIASLIGLGIGFILPSVRATLAGSPIAGAVRSVASSSFAALRTLGAGYSPVAVLVLAGSLARRIEPPTEAASELSAAGSMRIRRMGVGIALVRFLLMPLVGVAMVTFGGGIFTSPFAKFTILLQSIMPPAQNSTLILNMEGKGDAATQVARVLVGIYVLGIAVIPVGLSVFLSIAGL